MPLLWRLLSLMLISLFSLSAKAYQLTLNTSSFYATQATVAYDLIDGSPGSSQIHFGKLLIDDVESGSEGDLEDLSFYNTAQQQIILGNELIFQFDLVSGGTPSVGFFPDSFSLFLLGLEGFPLFPTADPTGADSLLQWDIGAAPPTVFAGILSNSTNPNPIPEPPTLLLILLALVILCLRHPRRLMSILLGGMIFANSSSAISAPSLATSTELGAQVLMTASGLRLNRQTNTFDSVLTIQNISQTELQKPFTVAVPSLPNEVILSNATAVSDEGIPLITIEDNEPLAPGQELKLTLKFVNRSNQAFPLSLRLVRLQQPVPALALLQGPDANTNGVRDDLEPLLDRRYAEKPSERAAASQVLKGMRNGLGATGSVESAFNAVVSLNKAFDCLYTVVGLDRGITESEFLRDQMMNTRERIEAWITLTNKVAGQSVPIGSSNACEAL